MNDAVLHTIRTRRVVRALTDAPVGTISSEPYSTVLATLLMPGTGDFTDTPSPPGLRPCVRCGWSYPGMLQRPMAAIVVCVDWAQLHNYGFSPANPGPYIDVGTAAETLLLAAHSIGLGAGPVTSFSRTAPATILNPPLECVPS